MNASQRGHDSFSSAYSICHTPRPRFAHPAAMASARRGGSDNSFSAAARFFKNAPEDVLVVHDDVDLDVGRLQARLGGGLAGHNGLRSIAQALGTPEFLRLRIGVGRPGRGDPRDVADYVLAPFEAHEDRDAIVARAADAVETLVTAGLEETQTRFN